MLNGFFCSWTFKNDPVVGIPRFSLMKRQNWPWWSSRLPAGLQREAALQGKLQCDLKATKSARKENGWLLSTFDAPAHASANRVATRWQLALCQWNRTWAYSSSHLSMIRACLRGKWRKTKKLVFNCSIFYDQNLWSHRDTNLRHQVSEIVDESGLTVFVCPLTAVTRR